MEFTTNHALILDAITRIVGSDDSPQSRFHISDAEAMAFDGRMNPMMVQRVLFRLCGDTDPNTMSQCDREVEQEAGTLATHIRQKTTESVASFASLLKNMGDVPGPKSLIILSHGLMVEGSQGEVTTLATLAEESRVNINVLMFSPPIGSAAQARASETPSQDRDLREAGLEALAGRSRGTLFRVAANPQGALERVRNEISAYYLLGVEPAERDRDGKTASDPRAGRAEQRAGARTASGEICGPYAEYLVARCIDGPRAAVAVGEYRTADAPVRLHVPRRSSPGR